MVLSHLAWKSDSPFFNAVDTAGSVPSYEEVAPSSPSSLRTLSSPFPLPPMRTPGKGGFGEHVCVCVCVCVCAAVVVHRWKKGVGCALCAGYCCTVGLAIAVQ